MSLNKITFLYLNFTLFQFVATSVDHADKPFGRSGAAGDGQNGDLDIRLRRNSFSARISGRLRVRELVKPCSNVKQVTKS